MAVVITSQILRHITGTRQWTTLVSWNSDNLMDSRCNNTGSVIAMSGWQRVARTQSS